MAYERFLDKAQKPGKEMVLQALGRAEPLWLSLENYIRGYYPCTAEMIYFTRQCGWSLRYKTGAKTLCYVFPEREAFTVLIVLGKAEAEKAERTKDRLSDTVRDSLENTRQLHDGRWMWIRIKDTEDLESFFMLLSAKRKPKPQQP